MREKNRKPIASIKKLPQFTTMNVIDGQAGLISYFSLIFYSLTIDNILNIVVLLILAGVSISMLTGENGIITQAQNSKEATEQARVEELVDLAVNSLIGENQGSTNGITPEMVAEEVNEMENREDIYAEGSTFPTNIIFPEEDRKVEVNLEQKEDLSEMYEVAVDEKDIAPMDLFDYEIVDEAETSALKLSSLPTKKNCMHMVKPIPW